MTGFCSRRRAANRRFLMVVVGTLGLLGIAWLAGFAVSGGRGPSRWAVLVTVVAVGVAVGFAWLLAKVSHGGDWAGGAGRRDSAPGTRSHSTPIHDRDARRHSEQLEQARSSDGSS